MHQWITAAACALLLSGLVWADKTCDKCIEAREKVQAVFSEITAKVGRESDSALRPYIDKLVAHDKQGAKEHEEPIKQVKAALENCQWVSSIRY